LSLHDALPIFIVFLIVHLTPGNPAYIILGEDSSEESIRQLEHELGLDQPIAIQFFDWIKNMLTGDFGMSIYSSKPVLDIILSHLDRKRTRLNSSHVSISY